MNNHRCNIDYNVPENGDLDLNKFFVEASQQLETEAKSDKGTSRRFGAPCSSGDIEVIKKSRVPRKTQANTSWPLNIWREWAACRLKTGLSSEEHAHKLDGDITKMDTAAVSFGIQRFVLEARKGDGKSYSPDSLYQLCCGLQRAMRDADHNVNFFGDFEFAQFRDELRKCIQLHGQHTLWSRTVNSHSSSSVHVMFPTLASVQRCAFDLDLTYCLVTLI